MKKFLLFLLLVVVVGVSSTKAQVLNPNDPVIDYNENNPPSTPPRGVIKKWVRTKRFSWNTDNFKPYYYNGMVFRLRFPNNYDPSGNTKYPLMIFFTGRGEKVTLYDNEYQLRNGARNHEKAINDGKWNGFLLHPGSVNGYWGESYLNAVHELISQHLPAVHMDPDQVFVQGLSAGGSGTWNYSIKFPNDIAAALPISASSTNFIAGKNVLKYIPIWQSQGGKDDSPSPPTSEEVIDALVAEGTNFYYYLYPKAGHGTWDQHYREADLWPFLNRSHKANPTVLDGEYGRVFQSDSKEIFKFITQEEICPGDAINVRMGVSSGFQAYQWMKDDVVIAGATGNEFVASSFGTYKARFRRNGNWSEWSPNPIVVKEKEATVTPDIQVAGLYSKVIPGPDGRTSVPLELPQGFEAYEWNQQGNSTTLSTERVFTVNTPGEYTARVTEKFGCSSSFSNAFSVLSPEGTQQPAPIDNIAAFTVSKTALKLQWTTDLLSSNPATHFEIYRTTTAGENYELIAILPSTLLEYTDEELRPNNTYFYILRAINEFTSALVSKEVSAITDVDTTAPTAPLDITVSGKGSSSISLSWSASTDDVGVYRYDIYRDGVKTLVVEGTEATVFGLNEGQSYDLRVKARDYAGNQSAFSAMIVGIPQAVGFNYKYYEGNWSVLPDFNNLTPVKTGNVSNITRAPRDRNSNYAFYYEGEIQIPVAGDYTFETRSDDGSKLYIGSYNESNRVVDNDGGHGMRYREGTYSFPAAGTYPIIVTYFQGGGGSGLEIYWKNTAHGVSNRQRIPDAAFVPESVSAGPVPNAPTAVMANPLSYNAIDVQWTDNSTDETGFQIYRKHIGTDISFLPIATVAADITNYKDSTLLPASTYAYQVITLGQNGPSGIVVSASEDLGDINKGIAAKDDATGDGYIMFSKQNVFQRFSSNKPNNDNSDHLIAIKRINNVWHYDNNGSYFVFTPASTDLILATVDFSANTIFGLTDSASVVHGIEAGYDQGDLTFFAQRWGGGNNNGEFTIEGTFFTRNGVSAVEATTLAAPQAPVAINNLTLASNTSTAVNIGWDHDGIADSYELWQGKSKTDLLPIASFENITSTAFSYVDTNLDPHTKYYYRIIAENAGGTFEGAIDSVNTENSLPTLSIIDSVQFVQYNSTAELNLTAEDEDGDITSFTVTSLPAFATLIDYEDNTALLRFSPAQVDEGVYPNIVVLVDDGFGGLDSASFTLKVNNNNTPTLDDISDLAVNEGEITSVAVTASDVEGPALLSWTTDLPSFASLSVDQPGNATIEVSPQYIDQGSYAGSVRVTDQDGAFAEKTFVITVVEQDPDKTIKINFTDGSLTSTGWNNTTGHPSINDAYNNLLEDNGSTTSINLNIETAWVANGSNNLGFNTGSNSGIYPDNVLRTSYWTSNKIETVSLTGLDTNKSYSIAVLGSRAATNNRTTDYTIQGETQSLDAASNSDQTVSFNNLTTTNGILTIDIAKGSGSSYGYLNAMVVTEHYATGLPPAAPIDFVASFDPLENQVSLSWFDRSFDEEGYYIYRSNSENGVYNLIATTNKDETSYLDALISAESEFYYKVASFNSIGENATAAEQVIIPNVAPTIESIDDIFLAADATEQVAIMSSDKVGDVITLSGQGFPSFMVLTDNGDGSGTIDIVPVSGSEGTYEVAVLATDQLGEVSSENFILTVSKSAFHTYFVNFAGSPGLVATDWNNYIGDGNAGDVLQNIAANVAGHGAIDMEIMDAWNGFNGLGMSGTPLYDDNVTKSSLWVNSTADRRLKLSGLLAGNAYDFTFYASRDGGGNRTTHYIINGTSVSLNASYNADQVVTIKGIIPDGNGEVIITVNKAGAASYGYLNALVIDGYKADEAPSVPSKLKAVPLSASAISLSWNEQTNNELGFELWSSSDGGNNFNLVSSLGADVTNYTDNGLSKGITYYYKVRTILPANELSDFSDVVASSTINTVVSINFNAENPAASPWNNTNVVPDPGLVFNNLSNEEGTNTGIAFEIISSNAAYEPSLYGFNGENPYGVNTGNDSGVVPDNVMRSSWWMDPGRTAELRFYNLDISQVYKFEFFASRDGNGNRTSVYSINGEHISLNAARNSSNIVALNNVSADENGEIIVTITSDENAAFSYIGAIILSSSNSTNTAARLANNEDLKTDLLDNSDMLSAYPNPYSVGSVPFTLKFETTNEEPLSMRIFNSRGALITEMVNVEFNASNELNISAFDTLESGLYIIQVSGNESGTHIQRVMKR